MKKVITLHDGSLYKACFIISKKRFAIYISSKTAKNKFLKFFSGNPHKYIMSYLPYTMLKNITAHRPCNLGPQFKTGNIIEYTEKNKYHNLYGPARIIKNHSKNIYTEERQYYIKDINYSSDKFIIYMSIYNKLTYKRIY